MQEPRAGETLIAITTKATATAMAETKERHSTGRDKSNYNGNGKMRGSSLRSE
jgi:hypothetical protein